MGLLIVAYVLLLRGLLGKTQDLRESGYGTSHCYVRVVANGTFGEDTGLKGVRTWDFSLLRECCCC